MATRINISFPEEVLEELQSLVASGQRSEFIVEATRQRLLRERQRQALEAAAGAWSDGTGTDDLDAREYLDRLRAPDHERAERLEALRDPDR